MIVSSFSTAQVVGSKSYNPLAKLKIGETEHVNGKVPDIFCGAGSPAKVSYTTEENASGTDGGSIKIVNSSPYGRVVVFHLEKLPRGNYEVSAMVRLGHDETESLSLRFGKALYVKMDYKMCGMAEANIFKSVNAYPDKWFKITDTIRKDDLPNRQVYWKENFSSTSNTHAINIPSPAESIMFIDDISLQEISE